MDATAAPEEDKEENSEAKNDDNMLKDPIPERDVFFGFLGAGDRTAEREKREKGLGKLFPRLLRGRCCGRHASIFLCAFFCF